MTRRVRTAATIAANAVLFVFASCAASPPLPELPPSHPASPAADEAPESAPSSTLRMPVRKPRGTVEGSGKGHGR